jgi:transcriptional regulator with XRE-family HTH domain
MNAKFDPAIIEAEENLLIDFQFLLQEVMTQKGVTLSQLAEKAGVSKARISQVMRPDANPTAKTLARLFHALGEKICISRKLIEHEMHATALDHKIFNAAAEWQWSKGPRGETRIDDRLVAVVKDTSASNDNYAPRVVYIESDDMTLEAA